MLKELNIFTYTIMFAFNKQYIKFYEQIKII